jgi:SAM-dependent MidA family methyltransferase
LPELERYLILDLSGELKQRQQHYLRNCLSPEQFARIEWLSGLPAGFDGIVVANEVLDAMPVHLLSKQDSWLELGVGYDGQRFGWQTFAPGARVLDAIRGIESRLGQFPRDYRCEVNLNYAPWFQALNRKSIIIPSAVSARWIATISIARTAIRWSIPVCRILPRLSISTPARMLPSPVASISWA